MKTHRPPNRHPSQITLTWRRLTALGWTFVIGVAAMSCLLIDLAARIPE